MKGRNRSCLRRSGVSPLDSALMGLLHQAKGRETTLLRSRPGFTLLEILLALALMVVVLGLLGMAVDVHVRVADASRNGVQEMQSARLLLRQIADDLRSAIPVTRAPSSFGCLQGNRHELQVDVSRLPLLDRMQTAALLRDNALPVSPPGDLRTVTYLVAKPGDVDLPETSGLQEQSGGLLRRECERATFAWAAQQGQTDLFNRAIKVLSPEVEAIEFTYLDGGTEYQEWDSVQEGKLPAAVRIAISLRQPSRKPQELSAGGMIAERPSTSYNVLVDLPNARATLDKTLAADSGQSAAASQDATSSDSTKQGANSPSTGSTGNKPLSPGGTGQ
jgi:prepilin-type N-terminal cleavage/methylation domain-containing protein